MPFIVLSPAVVAVVLSYGSTGVFIAAMVNAVVSFFAINTILNLGSQQEAGEMIEAFERYKSGSVAVLTLTWIVAAALIVVTIA